MRKRKSYIPKVPKTCQYPGCTEHVYGKSPNSQYCKPHAEQRDREAHEKYVRTHRKSKCREGARAYIDPTNDASFCDRTPTSNAYLERFTPVIAGTRQTDDSYGRRMAPVVRAGERRGVE